jgi:hypothetical protein
MKTYWGSGGIAPRILDFGTRWRLVVSFAPRPLYPTERVSDTHRIGGWVGPSLILLLCFLSRVSMPYLLPIFCNLTVACNTGSVGNRGFLCTNRITVLQDEDSSRLCYHTNVRNGLAHKLLSCSHIMQFCTTRKPREWDFIAETDVYMKRRCLV